VAGPARRDRGDAASGQTPQAFVAVLAHRRDVLRVGRAPAIDVARPLVVLDRNGATQTRRLESLSQALVPAALPEGRDADAIDGTAAKRPRAVKQILVGLSLEAVSLVDVNDLRDRVIGLCQLGGGGAHVPGEIDVVIIPHAISIHVGRY